MHSLDAWPRVASGGWGEQASGRSTGRGGGSGLKKQSLGFGGRRGACSFPPFPLCWLVFSVRTLRSVDVDGMSADRVQEALACLF